MIDPKHSWIGQVDHSLFLRNAAVDGALLKMLYTQKIIKNETFLTRKNGDRLAVGTVEVAQLIILSIYLCIYIHIYIPIFVLR